MNDLFTLIFIFTWGQRHLKFPLFQRPFRILDFDTIRKRLSIFTEIIRIFG